jgi:hypothetical protein
MGKPICMRSFMQMLCGDKAAADTAAEIGEAILAAGSIRLTEIAAKMRGSMEGRLQTHSTLPQGIRSAACAVAALTNLALYHSEVAGTAHSADDGRLGPALL